MWSQTYKNGQRYYREHKESRSLGICPAMGGSIPCDVADGQVGEIITSLVLPNDWLDQALARLSLKDEVERVKERRQHVEERLRRLGQIYLDEVIPEGDYRYQKRTLELELGSLVMPEVDAMKEAAKLLQDLPRLWEGATVDERRRLLMAMLDAVYVDTKHNLVVGVKPKASFRPLLDELLPSQPTAPPRLDRGASETGGMPSDDRIVLPSAHLWQSLDADSHR